MSEFIVNDNEPKGAVKAPETWGIFICYRQVDGHQAAQWLYETLHGQPLPFIPEGYDSPPKSDVYFDQSAPAVDDWTRVHEPALQRARAMLLVCSPAAKINEGSHDWVHKELNWWLSERDVAPIIIDPTDTGDRYIPDAVLARWPNAQRLVVQPEKWEKLKPEERNEIRVNMRNRIIGEIRESERATTYEDLEKEKKRTRELNRQRNVLVRQRKVLVFSLLASVVAFILAVAAAWYANEQSREARRQKDIAGKNQAEAQRQQKIALARQLVAQSELTRNQYANRLPRTVLLAVESMRRFPSFEGDQVLRNGLSLLPSLVACMTHERAVVSVAFSRPDGKYLATTNNTTRLSFWRPNDLIAEASSRLTSNLTYQEWQQYIPEEPYDKTCQNLPIHPSFVEAGRDLTIEGDIEGGLAMCNRAVELEPENGECHHARGLARALAGDYEGAIEDFQFYIKWARDKQPERLLRWRQEWIGELKAGRNPFDEATLQILRNE